jgi:hypothetical protein
MPESEIDDNQVRCPRCKTTRLKVLKKIDRIEKLYGNSLMNRFRARRGDTIYHCVICRMQFYDARKPGTAPAVEPDRRAEKPAEPEKTGP